MNSRDIRTLKGVISELQRYLEHHIERDQSFLLTLRTNRFLEREVNRLDVNLRVVHEKMRNELREAAGIVERLEDNQDSHDEMFELARRAIHGAQTMERHIMNPGGFFIRSGMKSEGDHLDRFYHRIRKQGFGTDILNRIKEHQQYLRNFFSDRRIMEIQSYEAKIQRKDPSSFLGAIKEHITFNRPKIEERIRVGKGTVLLRIHFDKRLDEKRIEQMINDYADGIYGVMERYWKEHFSRKADIFRSRIQKKMDLMQKRGARGVEKDMLRKLRDVCVDILARNQDLILTPTFTYQLEVSYLQDGILACCKAASMIDHYLLGINIDDIITHYLICEDFDESIPDEVHRIMKQHAIRKHAMNDRTRRAQSRMQEMGNETPPAASQQGQSIRGILAHETQHAFDRGYLERYRRITPLLTYMIHHAGVDRDHKSLELGTGHMDIASFYLACRREAPTVFRELVPDSINPEETTYQHLEPLSIKGYQYTMRYVNELFRAISRRKRQPSSLTRLEYSIAHLINLTIFIADCSRNGKDLVFIDQEGMQKIHKIFPEASHILEGYSNIGEPEQGSTDWFFIEALRHGGEGMRKVLRENAIPWYHIPDFKRLIRNDRPIYIFRDHVDIMRKTLDRIEHSYEVTYFDMYERSSQGLGIPDRDRLLPFKGIKRVLRSLSEENKNTIRQTAREIGNH